MFAGVFMSLQSQTIDRAVIGVAGGSFSNANVSLEFTIGEAVTGMLDSEDGIYVTQGFNQPHIVEKSTSVNTETIVSRNIILYPNPVIDFVNFKIQEIKANKLLVKVIDVTGKLQIEKEFKDVDKGNILQLDMSNLKKGIYFVSIKQGDVQLKLSKIYKK